MSEESVRNHPYMGILKSQCENNPVIIDLATGRTTIEDYIENPTSDIVYVAFNFSETPYGHIEIAVYNAIPDRYDESDFFDILVKKITSDLMNLERYDFVRRFYLYFKLYTTIISESIFENVRKNRELIHNFRDIFQEFLLETFESGNSEIVDIILSSEDVMTTLPLQNLQDRSVPTIRNIDVVRKILNVIPEFFQQFEDFSISFFQPEICHLFTIENLSRKLSLHNFPVKNMNLLIGFFENYPIIDYLSLYDWGNFYCNEKCEKILELNPHIVPDSERIKLIIGRISVEEMRTKIRFFELAINKKFRKISETLELEKIFQEKICIDL